MSMYALFGDALRGVTARHKGRMRTESDVVSFANDLLDVLTSERPIHITDAIKIRRNGGRRIFDLVSDRDWQECWVRVQPTPADGLCAEVGGCCDGSGGDGGNGTTTTTSEPTSTTPPPTTTTTAGPPTTTTGSPTTTTGPPTTTTAPPTTTTGEPVPCGGTGKYECFDVGGGFYACVETANSTCGGDCAPGESCGPLINNPECCYDGCSGSGDPPCPFGVECEAECWCHGEEPTCPTTTTTAAPTTTTTEEPPSGWCLIPCFDFGGGDCRSACQEMTETECISAGGQMFETQQDCLDESDCCDTLPGCMSCE